MPPKNKKSEAKAKAKVAESAPAPVAWYDFLSRRVTEYDEEEEDEEEFSEEDMEDGEMDEPMTIEDAFVIMIERQKESDKRISELTALVESLIVSPSKKATARIVTRDPPATTPRKAVSTRDSGVVTPHRTTDTVAHGSPGIITSSGGPALIGTITVDADVYDVYQGAKGGVNFNSPNKNGTSTVKYITNNKKYIDAVVYS